MRGRGDDARGRPGQVREDAQTAYRDLKPLSPPVLTPTSVFNDESQMGTPEAEECL